MTHINDFMKDVCQHNHQKSSFDSYSNIFLCKAILYIVKLQHRYWLEIEL